MGGRGKGVACDEASPHPIPLSCVLSFRTKYNISQKPSFVVLFCLFDRTPCETFGVPMRAYFRQEHEQHRSVKVRPENRLFAFLRPDFGRDVCAESAPSYLISARVLFRGNRKELSAFQHFTKMRQNFSTFLC